MNALSKGRRLAKWNPGLVVVEGLGLILGHVHVPPLCVFVGCP